jgi:DNA-binding NarL/FixJ family response regulator
MLRSLKRLLEPEFEVAGMADNILSMLDALREIDPDMLVIDIGSAEFGAGDLARRLHDRHPCLCILLVGDDSGEPPAIAGVPRMAHVLKSCAQDVLIPTARALVAGAAPPGTSLAGPDPDRP